jgi:hypothetical protein
VRGVFITFAAIFLGYSLAMVDVVAGVSVIVVGGIAGLLFTWQDLS